MSYNALMIAFCFMFCILIALYAWHYLMDEAREAFEKWEHVIHCAYLRVNELGDYTGKCLGNLAMDESSFVKSAASEEADDSEQIDIGEELEYVYQTDVHAEQAVEGLEEARDRLYSPLIFVLLILLYISGQITPSETTAETELNPA